MTDYYIPAGFGESELTEKRSRFIALVSPVHSEEEAKAFIREVKKKYHDARHNCWCYRLYNGPERFSDDGEPQGSAGNPMLEVFRHENIQNVVCVVTRYFGGVLLGTGGLSRCYSGAAKNALLAAGVASVVASTEITFTCPYSMADRMKNLLLNAGAVLGEPRYGEHVTITALASDELAQDLALKIYDLSGGQIHAVLTSGIMNII